MIRRKQNGTDERDFVKQLHCYLCASLCVFVLSLMRTAGWLAFQ